MKNLNDLIGFRSKFRVLQSHLKNRLKQHWKSPELETRTYVFKKGFPTFIHKLTEDLESFKNVISNTGSGFKDILALDAAVEKLLLIRIQHSPEDFAVKCIGVAQELQQFFCLGHEDCAPCAPPPARA